ncbi:MAG TPA: transglutaminase family protein [Ktedonobacterales bacterium]|nr:transglutaminase family protein [Ktedonobacterales bacterium]
MIEKLLLTLTGVMVAGVGTLYLSSLPLLRRLPRQNRVSLDDVTSIDDAVEACYRTQLHGWDLAAYAQHLVARKFTYSRLNTWDTPSRAFERGMGYCGQQALALKQIYDRLGIQSKAVFARRCTFPGTMVDGMPWPGGITGHAWLRVRIGGRELEVCPGSTKNSPGVTQFEVLSQVHTLDPWLRPWTHLGSSIENIRRDTVARRHLREAAKLPNGSRPCAH